MKRKWEEKKEEEDAAQGDEGLDGYIPEWVMRRSRASAVRWGTEKQILLWDVSWKVSEKIPVDGVFFKVTRAFGKDNICMVLRCWWEYMASVWGCRNSVVVGSLKPPATMIQLLIKSRKIIKKKCLLWIWMWRQQTWWYFPLTLKCVDFWQDLFDIFVSRHQKE